MRVNSFPFFIARIAKKQNRTEQNRTEQNAKLAKSWARSDECYNCYIASLCCFLTLINRQNWLTQIWLTDGHSKPRDWNEIFKELHTDLLKRNHWSIFFHMMKFIESSEIYVSKYISKCRCLTQKFIVQTDTPATLATEK